LLSTVLFEDQTSANFRPLTWGLPTYELRCGMFNLRERVSLLMGKDCRGGLLPRKFLEEFHQPSDWAIGHMEVKDRIKDAEMVLFLNGRVGPDFTFIRDLMAKSNTGENLAVWDEEGLLAAWVAGSEAPAVVDSLSAWHAENDVKRQWYNPKHKPDAWDGGPVSSFKRASTPSSLRWIWELVPATAVSLDDDLKMIKTTEIPGRDLFGIVPDPKTTAPVWSRSSQFSQVKEDRPGVSLLGEGELWVAEEVILDPGTVIDLSRGPVIIDRGARIMPHVFLEGPLYIGAGAIIKAGATIYGESSFGAMCRISGEVGESTFGDFSNKQHDGFVGHAVLGSWVNLGAMTTNSDLKNNYGPVRVDLGMGSRDTGLRFVGLLMGDHAKTAIGTLFNTGTSVGFATNIFGGGMPPKYVGNFCWGGQDGCPGYDADRAGATAEVVMSRRGCVMQEYHSKLFQDISQG
jgi:UDP-N-acetylglucosamine diphosphorylase / glucose-1-phosphate thymidylyltransferase / UDP-N-acetylgalactosamine diphosphorylase / glucosamine-1-phosphate N-acetyltransferase / galactosamine-1-phosphate N-acetyltransferase